MVNKLVTWVRNLEPPGRFLQKNPDDGHKWYEIDDKTARLKASQVYRDTVAKVRRTKGRTTSDSHLKSSKGTMESSYIDSFDKDESNHGHDPHDSLFSHLEDQIKSMSKCDESDFDAFSFSSFRSIEELFGYGIDPTGGTSSDMCCDTFVADTFHSIREDLKAISTALAHSVDHATKTKHDIIEQINDAPLSMSESEQTDFSRNSESHIQSCQNNGSTKEKMTIEPSILCDGSSRTQISASPHLNSDVYPRPHMLNSPSTVVTDCPAIHKEKHCTRLIRANQLHEKSYEPQIPSQMPAPKYDSFDNHSQQLKHSRCAPITQLGAANLEAQDQLQGNSNDDETRAYLDQLLNNAQLQHSQQWVSHHAASSTATPSNPFPANEYIAPVPPSQLHMKQKPVTTVKSTATWFNRNSKGKGHTQRYSNDTTNASFSEVLKNYQMSILLDQLQQLPQGVSPQAPSASSPSMISTRTDASSEINSSALSSVSSGQNETYPSFRNSAAFQYYAADKISSNQGKKSGSRSFGVYQSYRKLLGEKESGERVKKRKSSRK